MKSRRPELIGRAAELALFDECLARAVQGSALLLIFEGEPGSGKTTLLDAIVASPALAPRRVRALRSDLASNPTDPVHFAAESITHAKLYARVGGRRRIGAIASKLLPDWLGALPIVGDILEAVVVTAQAVRKRLGRSEGKKVTEDIATIHKYARAHTVVLLIDDAHLLTEPDADRLLRTIDTSPAQTSLLVVCFARTPIPGAPPAALRLLHRLKEGRRNQRRIQPLGYGELHQWLNEKFKEKPLPPALINFLLVETGGQPGPVLSMIDQLVAQGSLRETASGWEHDLGAINAEATATDDAATYLASLRSDVAEIIRVASIFGDEFDALTLAQLMELDELDLEDRLAVAVRFGLLSVGGEWILPSGEISTLYRFNSSAARAALHRSLSAEQRQAFESRMSAL